MKWEPHDIISFGEDYLGGYTNKQLQVKYNGTRDNVDNYLRTLRTTGQISYRSTQKNSPQLEPSKERFISFLSKYAKTKKEIVEKFADQADELLTAQYDGLNLFQQRNNYGEQVYILLPEFQEKPEVKPRTWSFYHSISEAGDFKQAYQLVQFPDGLFNNTEEEIRLVPLFDVHYGHIQHKHEKFLSYIKYIAETPNVFTWLGGDIVNLPTASSGASNFIEICLP